MVSKHFTLNFSHHKFSLIHRMEKFDAIFETLSVAMANFASKIFNRRFNSQTEKNFASLNKKKSRENEMQKVLWRRWKNHSKYEGNHETEKDNGNTAQIWISWKTIRTKLKLPPGWTAQEVIKFVETLFNRRCYALLKVASLPSKLMQISIFMCWSFNSFFSILCIPTV